MSLRIETKQQGKCFHVSVEHEKGSINCYASSLQTAADEICQTLASVFGGAPELYKMYPDIREQITQGENHG